MNESESVQKVCVNIVYFKDNIIIKLPACRHTFTLNIYKQDEVVIKIIFIKTSTKHCECCCV